MATQGASNAGPLSTRALVYGLLALLALVPIVAFGFGPLGSDSFSLQGPAGPLLAFSAGVLSFVSPCVLPLVPIYITHLSGASIIDGKVTTDRRVTFTHAVAFVAGLSLVFIVVGSSVGVLGSYAFRDHQREMEQAAGVMLILMGLVLIPPHVRATPTRAALILAGLTIAYVLIAEVADLRGQGTELAVLGGVLAIAWLRFSGYLQIPFLARTFEVNVGQQRRTGYTRSALVGGAFALGWTPCVGPILGSILTLAASTSASSGDAWQAVYLLVAYSAGFSIPFLITGLALGDVSKFLRKLTPFTPTIEVASAALLVGLGLLLWYGRLTGLNGFFSFADFNQGL